MLVRPYAEADRDAVNAVARAAFAQYAQDYVDWPSFIDGIGRMADLSAHADVLVAEQDGVIVAAVAHVGPGRPRAAGCLRLAQEAGAPAVGLHTSPIMASALRMYEALGFVRDRDPPPIRGVPYGRHVLLAAQMPKATRPPE